MPRNTTVTAPAATWTQLTDADVASLTFQNVGSNYMLVKGTTTAVAPTDTDGSLRYNPGQGEKSVFVIDLFPGLSGADRVWAYAPDGTIAAVSHA